MALDLALALPPQTVQEAVGKTIGGVGIQTGESLSKLRIAVGNSYYKEYHLANYLDSTAGNDDAAFASLLSDCLANRGAMVVKGRPDRRLRITQSLQVKPADTDSEIQVNMQFLSGDIDYVGPSNRTVVDLLGVRACNIDGLRIALPRDVNVNNVTAVDLRTGPGVNGGPGRNSTTGINFTNGGVFLGSGVNNIGLRMGYNSPGAADISQITFENWNTNSAADTGAGQHTGAQNAISGQYGIKNVGHNTLNVAFDTCIFAYLERGYDNSDGGNGAVTFNNMVASHCKEDYRIGGVQNYTWTGCRSEDSIMCLMVTDSADAPSLVFNNCAFDNPVRNANGAAFQVGRPAHLEFIAGFIYNGYEPFTSRLIDLYSFSATGADSGRKGVFKAHGLQVTGDKNTPFFTVEGDAESAPRFAVDVKNCRALGGNPMLVTGFYANRDTQ